MIRVTLYAGFALMAAGCAGMSEEECLTADWRAIGYEDGAAGRSVSQVSGRRAACAKKAGITVDMPAYMRGRDDGLAQYCRPSNAYALGRRGAFYNGVCSGPVEKAFITAYEDGRQLYGMEARVKSISGQIRQAQYDLRNVERDIAETEVALLGLGHSYQERLAMLAELKSLSRDRGAIEESLIVLHRDHERALADLDAYRADVAYSRGAGGVSPVRY